MMNGLSEIPLSRTLRYQMHFSFLVSMGMV